MVCRKCHRENPADAVYCCYCRAKLTLEGRRPRVRGNKQGTVFKTNDGKYKAEVVVGWYMEDGKKKKKVKTKIFTKKADAVAALPGLLSLYEKPKDINLHDLHEEYITSKAYEGLSASQRNKLTYAWNRWQPMEFRGIATLTVADLQEAIDKEAITYYPARDMKVLMSHLYNIAIRREVIAYNKTEYVDLPESPKAKRESWTVEEVAALWEDYKTNAFTGYILIMCYAGLRYGELATIRLENIHLAEGYMIGGIKTEAGIDREIPLAAKIRPVILAMSEGRREKLLEMNEDRFYETYWATIARAGLRNLPPQTCRHYYFSRMTAAGIQGGIIAEVGGHADYMTTLKNYVRIPLADKLAAVNSIE